MVTLSVSVALLFPASVPAQTGNPDTDRTVPFGSPVGTSQTGTGQQDQDRDEESDPALVSTTPIEPVQIRGSSDERLTDPRFGNQRLTNEQLLDLSNPRLKRPATPGEFERYVQLAAGRRIKRFGSDLLLPSNRDYAVPAVATIPPDYVLNVGDVVSIALTGSVEGSVDVEIDRNGQIFLPRVGAITVAGVRFRDLRDRISAAVGRQYRGYTVTVSVKQLRGVRVYVTGFANNPGAYSVNSLSTMVNAVLAAGGPSGGGSFRSVKLYRAGREVADFDLYDLIRRGDRSGDAVLQNEDVLFIPPVGQQAAVLGSVNEEAIYETKPGESLEDVLRLAGGPTNLADPSRLILYRLSDRDTVGSRQVSRSEAPAVAAEAGDIVQVLAQGSLQRPLERQSVVVRIEGEVNRPGNYFVAPNTPLSTVLEQAGGLTARAFVYGTRFSRESVRAQQRESFQEAIEQLETTLAAAPLTGDRTIDAGERAAQIAAARATLDRLRQAEPDGRVVLDLPVTASLLPGDLPLENNDRIVIPPRATTVGVFGAVYRPASFLLGPGEPPRVRDFVERAGGPLRAADRGSIFVVRANGAVLTRRRGALSARVLPGDVVFVPVKTQSSSLLAKIRDISTIIFQLGVSAAALAAIN